MKKINKKAIFISIILVIFQSVLYLVTNKLQGTAHLVGSIYDSKIPFIIYFIIPYILWYILLFFVPYYLYIKDKNALCKYIISMVIFVIVANIIFLAYPSTIDRPQITGDGILNSIAKIIFSIDNPPLNCFPSLHCAYAALFILSMFYSKNTNKYIAAVVIIISILVIPSTLFIKQHVIADAIFGVLLSLISFMISLNMKRLTFKIRELL